MARIAAAVALACGGSAIPAVAEDRSSPSPTEVAGVDAAAPCLEVLSQRCPAWLVSDEGSERSEAAAIAVAPDGGRAFLVGWVGDFPREDAVIAAIDQRDGTVLWAHRIDGGRAWQDAFLDVAVSPDGRTVYATGDRSPSPASGVHADVAAFDAATGELIWRATYWAGFVDHGERIAVSPDGRTVYVAISSTDRDTVRADVALAAYDAATGELRWTKRHGFGNWNDHITGLVARERRVYLSTWGFITRTPADCTWTFAYPATDEEPVTPAWDRRYCGKELRIEATAMDVDPAERAVALTGAVPGPGGADGFALLLDPDDGSVGWVQEVDGGGFDWGHAVTFSPDGREVIVAASSEVDAVGASTGLHVQAFDVLRGFGTWSATWGGPVDSHMQPTAIEVSPHDGSAIVLGTLAARRDQLALVSVKEGTGVRWAATAPTLGEGQAAALALHGWDAWVAGALVEGASLLDEVPRWGVARFDTA